MPDFDPMFDILLLFTKVFVFVRKKKKKSADNKNVENHLAGRVNRFIIGTAMFVVNENYMTKMLHKGYTVSEAAQLFSIG